jgi:hypothetical protein
MIWDTVCWIYWVEHHKMALPSISHFTCLWHVSFFSLVFMFPMQSILILSSECYGGFWLFGRTNGVYLTIGSLFMVPIVSTILISCGPCFFFWAVWWQWFLKFFWGFWFFSAILTNFGVSFTSIATFLTSRNCGKNPWLWGCGQIVFSSFFFGVLSLFCWPITRK